MRFQELPKSYIQSFDIDLKHWEMLREEETNPLQCGSPLGSSYPQVGISVTPEHLPVLNIYVKLK